MRINSPVTNNEYAIPEDSALVSRTDLKGRITYLNPSFLKVSGYDLNEVMGKAHNVIRHPDMPVQAFADMWDTLASNLPWTGLVKNRRKNGDFYWVEANVTPIRHHGVTQGCLQNGSAWLGHEKLMVTSSVHCMLKFFWRIAVNQHGGSQKPMAPGRCFRKSGLCQTACFIPGLAV
ncbi:MAG: chemotaxis protein [Polaromonas sp.]|nr:chemotaxis protein [Polaromonas sp.]